MTSLTKKFNIPVMKDSNVYLNDLFDILQNVCPKHLINQWFLSLYVVKNETNINVIQYSQSLSFPNGFDLLVVFNPCLNAKVLVYVNNCVLQCDFLITGIQLHKHQCNSIRIVSQVSKVLCVLLRRVPRVNA